MNKIITRINVGGFGLFLTLFGIALYVGRFVYKVIGIPVLWMLYQLSKNKVTEVNETTNLN